MADPHSTASAQLEPLHGTAQVWSTVPEQINDPQQLRHYETLLSSDEKDRYQRFHFEKDRHRFLVSHALVRTVLSKYAAIAPAAWEFSVNPYGRPEISAPQPFPALRFNLSHTAGLAVCVVTLETDCGIDTEQLHAPDNAMGIAKKMFSASEVSALEDLDGDAFRERFISYWTLREAYCKALGTGIAHTDNHYTFKNSGNGQYDIESTLDNQLPIPGWQFSLLRLTREHLTTVALYSKDGSVKKVKTTAITP